MVCVVYASSEANTRIRFLIFTINLERFLFFIFSGGEVETNIQVKVVWRLFHAVVIDFVIYSFYDKNVDRKKCFVFFFLNLN